MTTLVPIFEEVLGIEPFAFESFGIPEGKPSFNKPIFGVIQESKLTFGEGSAPKRLLHISNDGVTWCWSLFCGGKLWIPLSFNDEGGFRYKKIVDFAGVLEVCREIECGSSFSSELVDVNGAPLYIKNYKHIPSSTSPQFAQTMCGFLIDEVLGKRFAPVLLARWHSGFDFDSFKFHYAQWPLGAPFPKEQTPHKQLVQDIERFIFERNLAALRRTPSVPIQTTERYRSVKREESFNKSSLQFKPLCPDDVPSTKQVYMGASEVLMLGNVAVPRDALKRDPWLEYMFDQNREEDLEQPTRQAAIPQSLVRIKKFNGDRDRDEFFEPSEKELARWRKKYTQEENGIATFKPFELPRFQEKQFSRIGGTSPDEAEHVTTKASQKPMATIALDNILDGMSLSELESSNEENQEPAEDIDPDNIAVYTDTPHEEDSAEGSIAISPIYKWMKCYTVDIEDEKSAQLVVIAPSEWDDPESVLRRTMGKDYHSPDRGFVRRSRTIDTSRETVKAPKSKLPFSDETVLTKSVSIDEQWNEAILSTFADASVSFDFIDGLYALVKSPRKPPRVHLIAASPISDDRIYVSDEEFTMGRKALAKELGIKVNCHILRAENCRAFGFEQIGAETRVTSCGWQMYEAETGKKASRGKYLLCNQ